MADRKKRILWHSDPATHATGFGNYTKYILSYLYKTGKYDIACYGCGAHSNDNNHLRFPWKTYSSVPIERPDIIQRANSDPNFGRMLSYGEPLLDEIVKDFKPDIYCGIQDWWGAPDFAIEKKFWNKINCIASWTADSLPLLDSAVEKAHRVEHHYVWAPFAEIEFKRLADELEKKLPQLPEQDRKPAKDRIAGWRRVQTLSGCVNEKAFNRLPDQKRLELRQKYGFGVDDFIVSTGSRSQLRKLFPQIINGFAIFKQKNPGIKTKLIAYTDVNEGWDLLKHLKEHGLEEVDLLLPYKCRTTGEIFYLPPKRGDFDNPKTGDKNSVRCIGLGNFAPESAINDFLNISDVFILCITSGGFELFLSQAKLTEIPTIANSYSCFEDQVSLDKGTIPVEENFTYEIGTGFKKSAVYPYSIYKAINKVYEMDKTKRREIGKAGRKFVLDNYSIEKIARKWEEIFDSMPIYEGEWNFWDSVPNNPVAQIPPETDDVKWIQSLYRLILCREPDHEGFEYWKNVMAQAPDKVGARKNIEAYFRDTATKNNQSLPNTETPEQYLRKNNVTADSVLYIMPKSFGDSLLSTSLFRSLKEQYPDKPLWVACEEPYKSVYVGNPYLAGTVTIQSFMTQQLFMQGVSNNKPLVFKTLNAFADTQLSMSYYGEDNLNLELRYKDKNYVINQPKLFDNLHLDDTNDSKPGRGYIKYSDGNIKKMDWNNFFCTGMPYSWEDGTKLAKEHGSAALGTVGYFYDNEGYLRQAGDIRDYL